MNLRHKITKGRASEMATGVISDEEAQFFLENGYLIVRGAVGGEELRRVQAALADVTAYGSAQVRADPDYMYAPGHKSGQPVLRRVEFVIDKRDECKVLLGNPFILRSAEKLTGPDLIPTWDSMVLKMPGEGIVVPWHRDAGTGSVGDKPIYNVDFYLDAADGQTCVWVIPGSHLWDSGRVAAWLNARPKGAVTRAEFVPPEAVPALMQPGDVLFHNILVLHGSPANEGGQLRRVLYYEFRPAHIEAEMGPHVPAYIPLKQKLLLACIAQRKAADYIAADEQPFVYSPPTPYNTVALNPDEKLPTYRYVHQDYWRPTAWTPDVMMQVRGVQQVRVSPDGKRVVYMVREAVMTPEKSEFVTQLRIANRDGSEELTLTYGEKSAQNPQWSPSGGAIAFTSNRKEKINLFLLSTAGGEAEPLTERKADVGSFAWSPDGSQIAFLLPEPLSEDEEKATKGRDDARWFDEDHKHNHLYRIYLQKDPAGKREAQRLTQGAFHINSFDWSPDGKTIVFAHQPTPVADEWVRSAVSTVELATRAVRELVPAGAAPGQPLYSPDGAWIALTISDDRPPHWAFSNCIHLVPAAGGEPKALPTTYDGAPQLIGWSADSKSLYFAEPRGTTTCLSAIDIASGQITDVSPTGGMAAEFALNATRTHVGFSFQATDQPVEAYTAELRDYTPRVASRANASLPRLPLGKTDVIRWQSADGLEVEGLLTLPVGYKEGERVPLLLVIHGGPAGVYLQTFLGNPSIYPMAAFSARGYATLRCNPRGSSGYGKDFRFANRNDWGGGDYQDLMTGVDHVIDLGIADPERLGVMGWSYGGFMTSWVITHTNRFKAASVGAAVTNLVSFTGTADIPGFIPDYFDGQFWDDLEKYRKHSPMFNVKGVTTPSLIQHGESDIRVPISQGYELYNALKAQGVPTRMLVLPRQPHGPNEPKLILKTLQSNLEWFEKYLK
jgi:dipeptidyl aminopeptidase/acylaminoacyl peptidase/ectoine hydroxylase-related dioxygenase (phytanoyl-CoA dioxygenase family)